MILFLKGRKIEALKNKGIKVLNEPFTCKGRAWKLINRKHPNDTDLDNARKYAEKMVAKLRDKQ
jgi:hypothetical protein